MTLLKHELKRGLKALIIWTLSITFLVVICILIFPEMKGQMEAVNEMFASMGAFSQAFGLDRINYGTFIGFYAVECGNMLGLGGAFYASLIASASLSKEEQNHTAEFLLSQPISRKMIALEKLLSVLIQIIVMNLIVWLLSVLSAIIIGENIPWKEMTLLNCSYLIMEIELVGICFGISSFVSKGSLGIGLGIATIMYFLNIICNLTDKAKFLKYITPFAYTDGANIVLNGSLDILLVSLGILYSVIGIVLGFIHYCKKDIKS